MAFGKKEEGLIKVAKADMKIVEVPIVSSENSPLVINKFSRKARQQMMINMSTPKAAKKSKSERPPRNFDEDFEGARHRSAAGWDGIPATAFRNSMVDACRAAGVVMTKAKQAIFVLPDGTDEDDGTALVRIRYADGDPGRKGRAENPVPERTEMPVRNDDGSADIRVRPMWRAWSAVVRIKFDAGMIDAESVVALLYRAGQQVGLCEGRPFSKNSCGMGWGTFEIVEEQATIKQAA